MTTRHSGYIVVLGEDIREDDAEFTMNALRMIRGVAVVTPIEANHAGEVVARYRADRRWLRALQKLLKEGPPELSGD